MSIPQKAVIFDMDGVVTDTASVHSSAWKQLFDAILTDQRLEPASGYSAEDIDRSEFSIATDYREYVDGRAREDGVRTLLAARHAALPEGSEADSAGAWTVQGQARLKNDYFTSELEEHGVTVFNGTVDLILRLQRSGIPTALVTASRNSRPVLEAAELDGVFDVIIDGSYALEHGIPGKPAPDMFLAAAQQLGIDPSEAAVIEDAVSGVQAARAGGFGLVVGINRHGEREDLERAGADVVHNDVAELDLGAQRDDSWKLIFHGFDPKQEGHREALLTLANGYMGVRGCRPERSDDGIHYPGTYVAGLFNRVVSHINGRDLEHESMVNLPNFQFFDIRLRGGDWWSEGGMKPLDEITELDLRHGVLTRTCTLIEVPDSESEDPDHHLRRVKVTQRRLVSMADRHLAAMETTITPVGWSGRIHVRSGIDPNVTNNNVREYKDLARHHLVVDGSTTLPDETLVNVVRTNQSDHQVSVAQRTNVRAAVNTRLEREVRPGGIEMRRYRVNGEDGQSITFDTTTAMVTSRDAAIASSLLGAVETLNRSEGGFEGLYTAHEKAWSRLWARFAVDIDADVDTMLALRLHIFHIVQTLSPNMELNDAGVTARGLHGEGYRGHIFWDEIFILPLITLRMPSVTRSLLQYRWNRLPAARHKAAEFGAQGAMFPWQSGSDGREETPVELYNPHSDRWMPDNSWRQFHVGLAIGFNAWQYYTATGDTDWLAQHGAELMIEISRFFSSLISYDEADERFHIEGAMGPDEYHDGYPGSVDGGGLKDNAYTNILAAWLFRHTSEIFDELPEHLAFQVASSNSVNEAELESWRHMASRLAVPFNRDGTISQFDGYDDLQEIDWDHYRRKYGNIGRMDLILESEGDATNNYKLSKQADTLMLVYLFGQHGLKEELSLLGYDVSLAKIEETIAFYLPRTSNGSTLSRVVTASIMSRVDPRHSWSVYQDALMADLDDTQGGTTQEGIHLGAMCGTLDVVQRAYAGVQVLTDCIQLDPSMPEELRSVGFEVQYHGQLLDVFLDSTRIRVAARSERASDVKVRIGGNDTVLRGGDSCEYLLEDLRTQTR
ncbi:beta-phosphoglucomutase family hydrolase [uncultured Kocuria sp.]|uniref:beta-phosphoglucomutase family hydrolase n=1 Tax=uncultured Kocuria sp. TaxID=259305 RepID=UPI00259689BF|nr:beta-phosphoglucomutase family hydrolase [uncultured Kocuria sp.]MCT1366440.1 beta-phosphoglucomutase family hydrolase [Rothia sp. p3-SID1597]